MVDDYKDFYYYCCWLYDCFIIDRLSCLQIINNNKQLLKNIVRLIHKLGEFSKLHKFIIHCSVKIFKWLKKNHSECYNYIIKLYYSDRVTFILCWQRSRDLNPLGQVPRDIIKLICNKYIT